MSSNVVANHGSGSQFIATDKGSQYNNGPGNQYINSTVYIGYQDEQNRKCLQDLRLSDPRDDKRRIEVTKGGLFHGASDWILNHNDFLRWKNGDARLLWIKGDPGKGKTMLLITIVEELEKQLEQSKPDIALSYFFCQGTDQNLNNATAILRGLIYLLVVQQPMLISHLRISYDSAGSKFFQDTNSFFALSKVLENMLLDQGLGRAYLLLDALDECEVNQKELLNLITRHTTESSRVQWIISSRNKPEIEQHLTTDSSKIRLGLEITGNAEQVSRAIGAYIDKKLSGLQSQHSLYDIGEIRRILRQKANGTFLWVSLVIEELNKADSWDIMDVLQEIPPTLEALYARMIKQIQKLQRRNPEFCRLVLSTATLAYRPLHLEELGVLSNLPKEISTSMPAIRKVVAMCGSLLTVKRDIVYIIHQSAQDYLSSKETAILSLKGHTDIHHRMFLRSLYIMQQTLKRDIYGLRDIGATISEINKPHLSPLISAQYSCVYWISHFCKLYDASDTQNQEKLSKQSYIFLQKYYLFWLEALALLQYIGGGILSVTRLRNLVKEKIRDQQLVDLVEDLYRFIRQNRWVIENYPLQTYVSALVFNPTQSLVRKLFSTEEPQWIKIQPIVEKAWSHCQQTLEGHRSSVQSVAFSPDSKLVASGSIDKTVKIWDTATGALQQTLEGHGSYVQSVAFSPDSKLVASGSIDKTVKIWDTATGALQQTLEGHGNWVTSVAFSPDSKLVASSSDDSTVKIWDAATGALQQTLEGHGSSVQSVAFSPDSKLVASGSDDNTVKIWDTATGALQQTLEGHGSSVTSVAFSPDSKLVASGSYDKTVKIWDTATEALQQTLEGHGSYVKSVAFSPDSKLVASGSDDKTVKIWDAATGAPQQTLEGHGSSVQSVAFSPDSKLVASGSYDKTVKIWDTATGALQQTLEGHRVTVLSVAFSPDSKLVASGSGDNTVKIWDAATGAPQRTLEGHGSHVQSVAFSPDSKLVVSGSGDNTVKIWDAATGALQRTLEGHGNWVTSVAFSPDSKLVASGSGDSTVKIWDAATGVLQQTLEGHSSLVTSIFSSPSSGLNQIRLHSYGINSDKSWISWNGQRVLWLPPDHRPYTSAILSLTLPSISITQIALGMQSGKVTIMGFLASGPNEYL